MKVGAGRLYGWHFANVALSTRVIRFYDKASAPTVGTDVPLFVIVIPTLQTVDHAAVIGRIFTNGIAYSVTAAVADLDATATAVNDVLGSFLYA